MDKFTPGPWTIDRFQGKCDGPDNPDNCSKWEAGGKRE